MLAELGRVSQGLSSSDRSAVFSRMMVERFGERRAAMQMLATRSRSKLELFRSRVAACTGMWSDGRHTHT